MGTKPALASARVSEQADQPLQGAVQAHRVEEEPPVGRGRGRTPQLGLSDARDESTVSLSRAWKAGP